ncbi:hypothetical protein ACQ4PT_004165 [Festuca glaucescens]
MDLVVGASSDAVKSLVGKLGSLLAQEYTLIQGVRHDIQYINDVLTSMQAFLNRTKRSSSHDEQRQDWMKQVREVSYDIEDCIDDVNHCLGHEPRGTGKLMFLKKTWYLLTTIYARRCIATEIRDLKVRVQHVSDRRTRYGVENLTDKEGSKPVGTDVPTDRITPPPQLIGTKQPVGVDDAIYELRVWFKKEEHYTQQGTWKRFLAIVGFGGLGKTTLALELYCKFGDEFDCRASVQASQKFNLLLLLRNLVKQFNEQLTRTSHNDFLDGTEEWEDLKKRLADQLEQKRAPSDGENISSDPGKPTTAASDSHIISSAPENSTRVSSDGLIISSPVDCSTKAALDGQNNPSKAAPDISTSHNPRKTVSDGETSASVPYNLTNDASDGQIISEAALISKAKPLLKKCGGLPLAIIVVAGLVASKLRSSSTVKMLDDNLHEMDKALSGGLGTNLTTEGVTKLLGQCYNDLPADLKTCLLYLSMFPKGCFISRKRLIRRRIAEGFIIEKHGKTEEEVAEDCFSELISRNLIRAVNNSSNGKVKKYQIHDMVLEYIVSKSSDENFITVVGGHWQTPFPSYKVRRLSVHRSAREEKETVERMKLSHVRSLTAFESFSALHSSLPKFQILQVLDLESCRDLSPHQLKKICKLHQLKYLSLRQTDIGEIPSEIGRLEYLEVLDIRETEVAVLPPSVVRLQRMAHLLAGNKSKRVALALTEEITKMISLQTLSGVEIRGRSTAPLEGPTRSAAAPEHRDGCSQHFKLKGAISSLSKELLQDMEKLTNLKKLSIYILGKFEETDKESLLSAIEHLSSCSLKFLAIDDDFTGFLEHSLNCSKAPPEHLHTLELSGMLSKVPSVD